MMMLMVGGSSVGAANLASVSARAAAATPAACMRRPTRPAFTSPVRQTIRPEALQVDRLSRRPARIYRPEPGERFQDVRSSPRQLPAQPSHKRTAGRARKQCDRASVRQKRRFLRTSRVAFSPPRERLPPSMRREVGTDEGRGGAHILLSCVRAASRVAGRREGAGTWIQWVKSEASKKGRAAGRR
jgi:hypothetical protein